MTVLNETMSLIVSKPVTPRKITESRQKSNIKLEKERKTGSTKSVYNMKETGPGPWSVKWSLETKESHLVPQICGVRPTLTRIPRTPY